MNEWMWKLKDLHIIPDALRAIKDWITGQIVCSDGTQLSVLQSCFSLVAISSNQPCFVLFVLTKWLFFQAHFHHIIPLNMSSCVCQKIISWRRHLCGSETSFLKLIKLMICFYFDKYRPVFVFCVVLCPCVSKCLVHMCPCHTARYSCLFLSLQQQNRYNMWRFECQMKIFHQWSSWKWWIRHWVTSIMELKKRLHKRE